MSILVRWEIEDGYTGSSRPQSFRVDAEDFQHCVTDADFAQVLSEITQEEFAQKVSFVIKREEDTLAEIKAAVAELDKP